MQASHLSIVPLETRNFAFLDFLSTRVFPLPQSQRAWILSPGYSDLWSSSFPVEPPINVQPKRIGQLFRLANS
jgi:hypothetical protein